MRKFKFKLTDILINISVRKKKTKIMIEVQKIMYSKKKIQN